jgi:hypothetical protein
MAQIKLNLNDEFFQGVPHTANAAPRGMKNGPARRIP